MRCAQGRKQQSEGKSGSQIGRYLASERIVALNAGSVSARTVRNIRDDFCSVPTVPIRFGGLPWSVIL